MRLVNKSNYIFLQSDWFIMHFVNNAYCCEPIRLQGSPVVDLRNPCSSRSILAWGSVYNTHVKKSKLNKTI